MTAPAPDTRKRKRDDQDQRRTSHACSPCRRRKVKCNSTKPCCQNCLRLKDKCQWPDDGDERELHTAAGSFESLVNTEQRHVLHEIFFTTPHLDIMRQSIHRLSFESTEIGQQSEFLLVSIYCLSALHISESDVRGVFNGETASKLSQRFANLAQKHSRDTSDQPSVASTQANLLLGFRELLCRTGYKAWMYTGLAIRMSQALRLGREYHQRHSVREQEVRRRTLWTCFIMDRLVSSICSRPQTLRAEKLRVQLPCPERPFLFGETQPGPVSFLDSGPDPGTSEVLPYFIKAVENWGRMTDIFASGVKGPSSKPPTDSQGDFYKAETAILSWIRTLPTRMQWSMVNYRAHRLLGQGSMFVSMHFVLNHAFCIAHQEYLPEFEGDTAFDDATTPDLSSNRSIVQTCLSHADDITRLASLLYSGDETDREMLRAPFVGVALESAACCHLWRINQQSQMPDVSNLDEDHHESYASARQKLDLLCEILKSWSDLWPIASSWHETIELLSRLYQASNPTIVPELDEQGLGEDNQPLGSGEVSIGSGYPFPQHLSSQRMFDNIRMIIMTASDPPTLRNRQIRLHVQNLWDRSLLQSRSPMQTEGNQITRARRLDDIPEFEDFDDMLNFMDDFPGLQNFDPNQITTTIFPAADPQQSLPFP